MKFQKHIFVIAICIAVIIFLTACGVGDNEIKRNDKISIVCTTFPAFDWVTEIIGDETDKFDITLLSKGGDLHSYQPSAKDIARIQTCDLFLYVGGISDQWADKIVREKGINGLKLFDVVKDGLVLEHKDHERGEVDEHIWLSLRLAKKMVQEISDYICDLDDDCEDYRENAKNYCTRLEALDKRYEIAAANSSDKTVIFADRFPFLYLTEDYGIEVIAAFPGCSTDSDVSFEVITELSEKIDQLGKETVLVLENSNQTVADTVIKNTKNKTAKTAVMNSCQSIGDREIKQGADYLEIMTKNLDAICSALD